jgi:hypothetical protein
MSREINQEAAELEAEQDTGTRDWTGAVNWYKDAIKDSCNREIKALLLESLANFKQLAEEELGTNIEYYMNDYFNPLLIAANNGHLEIVMILLENGLSRYFQKDNYTSEGKNTLLLASAIMNSLDSIKFMVSEGADINFCNTDGETAFLWAIRNNNLEMVTYFLSQPELDLDKKIHEDSTALELLTSRSPYLISNFEEFDHEILTVISAESKQRHSWSEIRAAWCGAVAIAKPHISFVPECDQAGKKHRHLYEDKEPNVIGLPPAGGSRGGYF